MRNANERPQKAVQGNNKNLLYYIDPWSILHTRPCDIIQGHSRPNRQQKFTRAIKGHKRSWKAIEGHKMCYKITKVHNHAQNLMSSRLTNFWQPTVHVQHYIFEKTSLRFFWHLFRPNCLILGRTVSLWKRYENGKISYARKMNTLLNISLKNELLK